MKYPALAIGGQRLAAADRLPALAHARRYRHLHGHAVARLAVRLPGAGTYGRPGLCSGRPEAQVALAGYHADSPRATRVSAMLLMIDN